MKKCLHCKKEKELQEFNITRRNLDGLNSLCKICQSRVQKQYRTGRRYFIQ